MNTNEKIYELAIRMQCHDRGIKTPYRQNLAHYIELATRIYESGNIDNALNLFKNENK